MVLSGTGGFHCQASVPPGHCSTRTQRAARLLFGHVSRALSDPAKKSRAACYGINGRHVLGLQRHWWQVRGRMDALAALDDDESATAPAHAYDERRGPGGAVATPGTPPPALPSPCSHGGQFERAPAVWCDHSER